jgi:hypothetical protein
MYVCMCSTHIIIVVEVCCIAIYNVYGRMMSHTVYDEIATSWHLLVGWIPGLPPTYDAHMYTHIYQILLCVCIS